MMRHASLHDVDEDDDDEEEADDEDVEYYDCLIVYNSLF